VLESTVAAAIAAEEAGFDDVWVAEHHFTSYGICPSAITLAGYLLGTTRRVAVGTAVSVLSTQHPVALAEQAALLDQVSGGRFRLGVGRGGPWIDATRWPPRCGTP
jgi:alkanesulfonate monooxygenase SsuD/methylene tetrahydromethanopterin reductase-like flavin-dependent oxidoreductase (luciferase family)